MAITLMAVGDPPNAVDGDCPVSESLALKTWACGARTVRPRRWASAMAQ